MVRHLERLGGGRAPGARHQLVRQHEGDREQDVVQAGEEHRIGAAEVATLECDGTRTSGRLMTEQEGSSLSKAEKL